MCERRTTNGGHQTAGAPAPTKNDEQQLHLDHTAPTSPPHCNAYPAPSEGGFIGREEKMAGKNDCGKAGNGWRETGGGKKLARTYGGKGLFIIEGQGFCIDRG